MQNETVCPFFEKELYKSNEFVGIECQGATIHFANKTTRREFVYSLCGSIGEYENCKIYKELSEHSENDL